MKLKQYKLFEIMPGTDIDSKYLEKRDCYRQLEEFMQHGAKEKICALYGLRRTGKTVIQHQYLAGLSPEEKEKSVYILCQKGAEMFELKEILMELKKQGIKNVFIDEVTAMEDFNDYSNVLSDVYASVYGMKIVITGTDSLGVRFASRDVLYDRIEMIHTSYVPFGEFVRLLPEKNLDDYIRYGGTLTDTTYKSNQSMEEYLNTAIVHNIMHSLEKTENPRSIRASLTELYDNNEFVSAVNKIISTFSTHMLISAIRRQYKNGIMSATIGNLKEKDYELLLERAQITEATKTALEIKNIEEMKTQFTEEHLKELKEYLKELDLLTIIPTEKDDLEIITQWGMIYAHLTRLMDELTKDDSWTEAAQKEDKALFMERADGFVKGILLENIILYETYLAERENKDLYVTKYDVTIDGKYYEADMMIVDRRRHTAELYEIKYSSEQVPEQYKHLENEVFIKHVEQNFGTVTQRTVLYRGTDSDENENGISYLNAEQYLERVNHVRRLQYECRCGMVDEESGGEIVLNRMRTLKK